VCVSCERHAEVLLDTLKCGCEKELIHTQYTHKHQPLQGEIGGFSPDVTQRTLQITKITAACDGWSAREGCVQFEGILQKHQVFGARHLNGPKVLKMGGYEL
jgi:hypothetical protein